ncbi:phosphodiester glycosidase family protein [Akkermansiaceae bacterium]|nr:phosphodiester glycosidase family protein [Akkermansiaceae bacterium]MDB4764699.1 phosphodiester glycosidase family protein [Akkermansiaceae bacterium]
MKLLWNFPFILSLIALLGACSVTIPNARPPAPTFPLPPVPQAVPVALSAPAPISTSTPSEITPKDPPPPPILEAHSPQRHSLKVSSSSLNGTTFTAVTFDGRDYFLKVIDQKGGPGTEFARAEFAGQGSLAAINGGFFNPDGSPLGLVITDGQSRGVFNASSFLGTGIIDGENTTLSDRKSYQKSSELLQSGPRLVWNQERLTGLSKSKERPRSFVIWDGHNHFGIGHADRATLQGLANNLQAQPFEGFHIKYAINLDGGTSCDLWVSNQISGGGFTRSSLFRKKARNYLALRKR